MRIFGVSLIVAAACMSLLILTAKFPSDPTTVEALFGTVPPIIMAGLGLSLLFRRSVR